MLTDAGLVKTSLVEPLLREANELTAIIVSSIKTSRRNAQKKQPAPKRYET